MRKNLFPIIFLFIPISCFAQENEIFQILERFQNFLVGILLVIGVICFMYAGYLFLSAEGNPAQLERARNAILWGIIGLAIGILSKAIVEALKRALGV